MSHQERLLMSSQTPAILGARMAAEIGEQPEALQRLLDRGLAQIRQVAAVLRAARPRFALLAGRGTSDHAALYGKYLLETRLSVPCGLASPSTLTRFDSRPELSDVLWIAVSQSGSSQDLIASTQRARELGALTIAITNAPHSALAAASALHIDILAGPELAVAATKSYTSQLLAFALLVELLCDGDTRDIQLLPSVAAIAAESSEQVDVVAEHFRESAHLLLTGRGFAYPTALEAALKLIETCNLPALAYSSADFRHGPVALVHAGEPLLAVMSDLDRTTATGALPHGLRDGKNLVVAANVATINAWNAPPPDIFLPLPTGPAEHLSPITDIIPLQHLARSLSLRRNHNPDLPAGLTKITTTW